MPALAILTGIGKGLALVGKGLYYGAKFAIGTAKLAWKGAKLMFRDLKKVAKTGKKLYKSVAKKIEQGATITSMTLSKQGSYLFNPQPHQSSAESLADKLFKEKISGKTKTTPKRVLDTELQKSHVFTKKNE